MKKKLVILSGARISATSGIQMVLKQLRKVNV